MANSVLSRDVKLLAHCQKNSTRFNVVAIFKSTLLRLLVKVYSKLRQDWPEDPNQIIRIRSYSDAFVRCRRRLHCKRIP